VQPLPDAPGSRKHGRAYNLTERIFQAWLRLYDVTLRVSLRFRAVTAVISVVLMVATGYLFVRIPKGFLPSEDQGRLTISNRRDPRHRLQ